MSCRSVCMLAMYAQFEGQVPRIIFSAQGERETAGPLRCRKHFQERSAELQIPPLRFASVGMTKGAIPLRAAVEPMPFFILLGGPRSRSCARASVVEKLRAAWVR